MRSEICHSVRRNAEVQGGPESESYLHSFEQITRQHHTYRYLKVYWATHTKCILGRNAVAVKENGLDSDPDESEHLALLAPKMPETDS